MNASQTYLRCALILGFLLVWAGCGDAKQHEDANANDGEPQGPVYLDPAMALPPRPDTQLCTLGDSPPELLSETGCFTSLSPLTPALDLVPYEINSQLWSDATHKRRYIVLPPGTTATATASDAWEFPVGTLIIKVFALDLIQREGWSAVEFRFMKMTETEGWRFFTYRVDEDGKDAKLLDHLLVTEYSVRSESEGTSQLPYYFPDEKSCGYCHGAAAGKVLGPITAQLDRVVEYEDGRANQLEVFAALGFFEEGVQPHLMGIEPRVDPMDEAAPIAKRARSYLDANCAYCHRPGGWQPTGMSLDLRYDRTLAETMTCNVPLQYFNAFTFGEIRIEPGYPEESNLLQRMIHRGPGQMPPSGTFISDPFGVKLVSDWIIGMKDCEEDR